MKKIEISNAGSRRAFLFATTGDYREWASSAAGVPYHPSVFAAIVPITVPERTIIPVTDMLIHPYDDNWFVYRTYDIPRLFKGKDITGRHRELSYMAWAIMHPDFKIL